MTEIDVAEFLHSPRIVTCTFEVFGHVQGVYFRRYTHEKAIALNVHGWCKNTINDTVIGELEGSPDQVTAMQHWLRTKGSPQSRIDHVIFGETKKISTNRFAEFKVND